MKMENNPKATQTGNTQDMSAIVRMISELSIAIKRYKTEHPDDDVDAILSEHRELLPLLGLSSSNELDRFVAYAKEQGTKMPFDAMELGVLTAGRKDMQDALTEIVNSLEFDKPVCPECGEEMCDRGRSKKKIITGVGKVDISPVRFSCAADSGQSAYPLLDFIDLVNYEETSDDGSTKVQTIKCTHNAAASIALACSESSYEQAALVLSRLAGLDLTTMTELRVTDCVGAEFVADVPTNPDSDKVAEIGGKISGSALETRVNQTNCPDNSAEMDEVIQKAVNDGPDGVLYKDYSGPTIKVMYLLCDGTGVPGRHKELVGVKGKQPDGGAKTFEAKIGAAFVVEYTADGKPLLRENGEIYRDKKVSYMGTVRKVEDFGPMFFQHALDNGLESMDAVVFLGDGARWVWGIRDDYFPYALTALDLYHSTERMNAMIDLLQFKGRSGSDNKQAFKDECVELLRCGKVHDMLNLVETATCKKGNEKKLDSAMGYFRSNMEHMNYGIFAACGIFVGSGVIEAGCKVIVGNRMKNAGMHWSKNHAEKMIALRCAIRNDNFFGPYLHYRASSSKVAA